MVAMSKKCCIRNLSIIDLNTTEKTGLAGSLQGDIKHHNLKNYFQEKGAKDKTITILLSMPTLHNFAHKVKTGRATMVVKSIFKN